MPTETTNNGAASPVEAATVPAAAQEPTSEEHETTESELQPPEHWIDQPIDDNDSALGDNAESSTTSLGSSILHYRTLHGRTYHSDRVGGAYWGANDEQQNEALDIQNQVFELSLDGQLHLAPIPKTIQRALDIGTGTGIWALDFGDQYPGCTVIGTDLSPIQPSWVPPNVRFEIENFADEWTFQPNSFDYIHMRWLVGSVPDWTRLFEQAYRALKPGGWIETYDCDGAIVSDDGSIAPKSAMSQWSTIYREGARKLGLTAPFDVVSRGLQRKSLEASHFVNINEKPIKIPVSGWARDPKLREIGLFQKMVLENDIAGFVGLFASQLGFSQEAIAMYAVAMKKQLRDPNVHAYIPFNVVWAQKPE